MNKKPRPGCPGAAFLHCPCEVEGLLDLAFFVLDVLARDGVVLPHAHLLGHGARVLLGHIEEARARSRVQADLNRGRLGHFPVSRGAAAPPAGASGPGPGREEFRGPVTY